MSMSCSFWVSITYENVMAAMAIAVRMGVPMDTIRKVVREFKAVEHRIEFVLEKRGVKYYNDSKGTNPDAAIQGDPGHAAADGADRRRLRQAQPSMTSGSRPLMAR